MARPPYKPLKTTASEREVQRTIIVPAFKLWGIDAERQNTGAAVNAKGRLVMFGRPGNSDLHGELPLRFAPNNGKRWMCECKKEGFNPRKCYGQERERFEKQLARLRQLNDAGGYGFWSDGSDIVNILQRIKDGWRVRIADDEQVELLEQE